MFRQGQQRSVDRGSEKHRGGRRGADRRRECRKVNNVLVLERSLATNRSVETGKGQERLCLVLAFRGSGRNDGNGTARPVPVAARQPVPAEVEGVRRPAVGRYPTPRKCCRIVCQFVHPNHAWMIGERSGSCCITLRRTCRSLKKQNKQNGKRKRSCRCLFLTEKRSSRQRHHR